MTIRDQIIKELKRENLTSNQLSENLEIDLKTIQVTISRMKKVDLLKNQGYKDKFEIHSLNPASNGITEKGLLKCYFYSGFFCPESPYVQQYT